MTEITAALVSALVDEHLPQFAGLAVVPVEPQGWDNRTFRLGDDLVVRLPSADGYSSGIEKEDRVLPLLAGRLPVALPEVVASVGPSVQFGRPWTVRRWLPGTTPDRLDELDLVALADDLGSTLRALREVPATEGPWAGQHTHHRGVHPSVYGADVQACLVLPQFADVAAAAREVWLEGMDRGWSGEPVGFPGDVAVGNMLIVDGAAERPDRLRPVRCR
ncbi:phosphotransferase [Aestuariimicrobium ganziense]|uniref:phosphotransferase n=1 Tax=Aestuariimicrobium ganziense TaxID=2773677 RepID=UPI001944C800|nr:phosphotransferase [Aestuariimicrobium ganziense]